MKRRRNVVITGAGAVMPWNAPRTDYLTTLLRDDNVFVNENGDKIGEFLFGALKKRRRYYEPNFETLLHLIEILFQFKIPKYQSPNSSFRIDEVANLADDLKEELDKFEKKNPNARYDINSGGLIDTAFKTNCLIANEYYYSELYLHYLFLIKREIEKYDNEEIINDDAYKKINQSFRRFYSSLSEGRGIIRYYTLNYDSLPQRILDIEIFDGYLKSSKIDIKRIIEKKNIDCYYNLHGSIKLNLIGEKSDNHLYSKVSRDYTENDLISSIFISGYNKLNRILELQYFHLYNTFVSDCYDADQIYIIGYSFGDRHINAAINGAMHKGKTQIICIDKVSELHKSEFKINFEKCMPSEEYALPDAIHIPSPNINESKKLHLYLNGFEDFLRNSFEKFE